MTDKITTGIIPIDITLEMKNAYLDYAMSVIVSRALPDVRDGMKPVHRRVIYAMYEQNNLHNRPYKKSARIVGDVLGKYHPHGDTSVYDALVRLAQDFSMRYPLIDGQGNFGSIDGDSPAAMRYTEVRLSAVSSHLIQSLDEETVDFAENYDGSEREPTVLPTIFPQLLVNGQSGIAVGMATNIPPHNLSEILNGLVALLEDPEITISGLMEHITGPDFPTYGMICGTKGIREAYETGRGSVIMRGRAEIETAKSGKETVIITEFPYQINKAAWIEKLADLVKNEEITGISDLRDESNKDGIRVVIEIKKSEMGEVVLNHLYKKTRLQDTFGVNMVCIVDGVPRILNLKQCLEYFRDHRLLMITKRTQYRLKKASERLHLLEGMKIAVENIDDVVAIIRKSKNSEEAKGELGQKFSLSTLQSQAILDLRLGRLTALEREKVIEEHASVLTQIKELQDILGNTDRIIQIAKDEFLLLKEKFGDGRRTEITTAASDVPIESLIVPADNLLFYSSVGYIKRIQEDEFRSQLRAGKGKSGTQLKESDVILFTLRVHTHDHLLLFSNLGKVYALRSYEIPESSMISRGKPLIQILPIQETEKLSAIVAVKDFTPGRFLFMVTAQGVVKRLALEDLSNIRSTGIRSISLDDGDHLIGVMETTGDDEVLLATAQGKMIRFHEDEVRCMGRSARGVIGINLDPKDRVIDSEVIRKDQQLLVVTEKGYGKRSQFDEYRVTGRAGKGVYGIRVSHKNGCVTGILSVLDTMDVILTTTTGRVLRTSIKYIPIIGRVTQGVCLMRTTKEETVVSIAKPNEYDSTPVTLPEESQEQEENLSEET